METLRFFEKGFEWRSDDPHHDYEFILYKDVEYASQKGASVELYLRRREEKLLDHIADTSEEAEMIVKEVRSHVCAWLNQSAVRREEERARLAEDREFRASLLAHLGNLTERIAFDPDVGDEALDAVERCKKRARGEEDE